MPIRRPRGKGRSAVLAVRREIDVWIRSCPTEARNGNLTRLETLKASTLELGRLRRDLHYAGSELAVTICGLQATLEKLVAVSGTTSKSPPPPRLRLRRWGACGLSAPTSGHSFDLHHDRLASACP
jgi:hypothetical protein